MATNKEETKELQIRFNEKLTKKIKDYVKLNNDYTTNKGFIINLIEKELEHKVLTNDFIELKEAYYFNLEELFKNNNIKASSEVPISNLEEYAKIIEIPNNLDKYSTELNSYCYNNSNYHLGIDLILITDYGNFNDFSNIEIFNKFNKKSIELLKEIYDIKYILFKFNEIEKTLEIGLITPYMLSEIINTSDYEETIEELNKRVEETFKAIEEGFNNLKPFAFKYELPYIIPLKVNYQFRKYLDSLKQDFINYCNQILEYLYYLDSKTYEKSDKTTLETYNKLYTDALKSGDNFIKLTSIGTISNLFNIPEEELEKEATVYINYFSKYLNKDTITTLKKLNSINKLPISKNLDSNNYDKTIKEMINYFEEAVEVVEPLTI